MEHDSGNPEGYRAWIQGGVRLAMNILAGPIAASGVGLPVSLIAFTLLNAGAGEIAAAIDSAVGSDDDIIGTDVFPLAPKALIGYAKADLQRERDVEFNLATTLLSASGGSYKAYFDCRLRGLAGRALMLPFPNRIADLLVPDPDLQNAFNAAIAGSPAMSFVRTVRPIL